MSQFLRDEFLKNLSITADSLKRIHEEIDEIINAEDLILRNQNLSEEEFKKLRLWYTYIIRFDAKGFQLFNFNDVIKYFQDANKVERVVVSVFPQLSANPNIGKRIELHLDAGNTDNCYLSIQDDNKDWVDLAFIKIKNVLLKYRNRNWVARNLCTNLIVQLVGVLTGFIISLIAAIKLAPKINSEGALWLVFVAIFLVFSNIWTYLYSGFLKILDYYWPNISFRPKKGIHWILQKLIGAASIALLLYLITRIFDFISTTITPLILH